MTENEAYEKLGLKQNAGADAARKAYRRLAMKYHPDRNKTEEASDIFMDLTEAYEIIAEGGTVYERAKQERADAYTAGSNQREENGSGSQSWHDPNESWYRRDDAERRARAREYAKMRYEDTMEEIRMIQEAWYFPIFKVFHIGLILVLMTIGTIVISTPIIMIIGGYLRGILMIVLLGPLGAGVWSAAYDHLKFIQPYLFKRKRTA